MLARLKIKTTRGKMPSSVAGSSTLLIVGFVALTYVNTRHFITEHRRQLLQAYSEELQLCCTAIA